MEEGDGGMFAMSDVQKYHDLVELHDRKVATDKDRARRLLEELDRARPEDRFAIIKRTLRREYAMGLAAGREY